MKNGEWDALSDEEKAKLKAEMKVKEAAMSPEEKSAKMWKTVCQAENSAACIVGKKMKKGGVEAGLKAFQKMKSAEEGMYVFNEKEFNSLGYVFLYVEKTDEAIAVANDSEFGLAGAVWSRDAKEAERVARGVETGAMFINGISKSDPRLPFGGVKKSGYGRELSYYGIREFVNIKSIWVK